MTSAVVLTLHGVASDGQGCIAGQDPGTAKYTVTGAVFASLADRVAARPHATLDGFRLKSAGQYTVLTFDDGLVSDYTEVFPVLLARGIRATFFVSSGNIGRPGYLSREQIREMAAGGMEMASHGVEHRYLVDLAEDQARRELVQSKDTLEQLLGQPVNSFAPVGGHFLPWMVVFARQCGYRSFATMVPGRTCARSADTPLLARRNHVQAQHTEAYLTSLVAGELLLLAKNRIRYQLLALPKQILGMQNYDRIKQLIMAGSSR